MAHWQSPELLLAAAATIEVDTPLAASRGSVEGQAQSIVLAFEDVAERGALKYP